MLTPPQRANAASHAINAWVDALGGEHVLTDPASIVPFERATFATHQRVVAVLRPADAAQVAACLRIANEHRVPLYPISRGRNWGFGSAVPVTTDNVVLDLGRLDRITAYDGRLGVITVEPGVTFQQAHAFIFVAYFRPFIRVCFKLAQCNRPGQPFCFYKFFWRNNMQPFRIKNISFLIYKGQVVEV